MNQHDGHIDTLSHAALDLGACDAEPIHLPGSIQPHGVLLVISPANRVIIQASENTSDMLGRDVHEVLGSTIDDLLGPAATRRLTHVMNSELDGIPLSLNNLRLPVGDDPRYFHVVVHRAGQHVVVELERLEGDDPRSTGLLHRLVGDFLDRLGVMQTTQHLCASAAREVRRITGFDRVLIYKFDAEWNGTVIAEDRNEKLPSYLDLRFPASDIPRQARELYRLNRLRLIPDADYRAVPVIPAVNPDTRKPLDMTHALLRSVSPVHLEYMRNMGTLASMSISILKGGELWGLISCHKAEAASVHAEVRTACDFIGQILSMQIAAREHAAEYEQRIRTKSLQTTLLSQMAAEADYLAGLAKRPGELLELTGAAGAAIFGNRRADLIGQTPSESQVRRLIKWLESDGGRREVFVSSNLAAEYEPAAEFKDKAAGLIAVSISRVRASYILWFRPEAVQTVKWGGDPRKPMEPAPDRLHPRKSFETWKQTVRGFTEPWTDVQVESAAELRAAIINIVLHHAEERAELTNELEITNRELESFSYSVSHDLRAPFRHITGYSELLQEIERDRMSDIGRHYLDAIVESAQYAGNLVDHLLAFSRMNREALTLIPIDMNLLVEEVRRELVRDLRDRRIRWDIADLPGIVGDLLMMRLVVQNLLHNAVKYTRHRAEAVIEVGARRNDDETVFWVRDNGIGFDMQYVDKLFGVFQRLHRMEDFEGTGIGLANVRRIVERHGGKTWAEGKVDGGATFYFSLPHRSQE